ncbi:hypothetical protein GCM10010495_18010 [Kitasatospora herbaricolor]|uniref:hypothetical protein n=1 Tax=Kitasatospora herbaricolor TaxID=68217 RepID=UPI00174B9ADB|nr:hypothetical protein [Kitasatospora herbaricolor]MDQ0308249.1 hypothetical protein [Kitasatospora herbaricolor]GGV06281.1 hypothetical protein GCM10010495_18010 [Kitasatospora herbaricolor]
MTAHDRVAELIAEAARQRDAEKTRRARYAAARAYGLQARVRAKLARLGQQDDDPNGPTAA